MKVLFFLCGVFFCGFVLKKSEKIYFEGQEL